MHPKHRYLCEYPTEIFPLSQLWVHISVEECNNCNRSENRNQCNSGFKIIKFPQKNREFWKSRLLWIPRNVKIWVPPLILVTYTHQISALGDNSTTRYGGNNISQRDTRTYARTNEHSPVRRKAYEHRRKCSFGAMRSPARGCDTSGGGIQNASYIWI